MFIEIILLIVMTVDIQGCQLHEYECTPNECISNMNYCDGIIDCSDASDELPNCTPCNHTFSGVVGNTYHIEIKKPTYIPYFCQLTIVAVGNGFGDIIQLNFDTFSIGTFESFTQDGCPNGYMSIEEFARPATGGRWCGNAWNPTVYYSETPNITLTLALNRMITDTVEYPYDFRLTIKFLRNMDAHKRYGPTNQRVHRGRLVMDSQCDRVFEGCGRRRCRIQSPNYPGLQPRNLTCIYRIRERVIPKNQHVLIGVRPTPNVNTNNNMGANSPPIRMDDDEKCGGMRDYLDIYDGWGVTQTNAIAHLCASQSVIPTVIGNGAELTLKLFTTPYGNPFELSTPLGMELEIFLKYVDKSAPIYINSQKKCEFILTSFDQMIGHLENPQHTLPPNTTCYYHLRGQSNHIIWLTFHKYHQSTYGLGSLTSNTPSMDNNCDSVLFQIWDGNPHRNNTSSSVVGHEARLLDELCHEDVPKMCEHFLLANATRKPRPCHPRSESYISNQSEMTLIYHTRQGNVLAPLSFLIQYEFVDQTQDGITINTPNKCDRLFMDISGRFNSPKNIFFYGRGGNQYLLCRFIFKSQQFKRLKLTIVSAKFGHNTNNAISYYNDELQRWQCRHSQTNAYLQIIEYPWPDAIDDGVGLMRDCFCENITQPITITTHTANHVVMEFHIKQMQIDEDYMNYGFEANYEFYTQMASCMQPWHQYRLHGASGELTIRDNVGIRVLPISSISNLINHTTTDGADCWHQPWLIEPESPFDHYIYLKIRGYQLTDDKTNDCLTKNRIFVYKMDENFGNMNLIIICPLNSNSNNDHWVELFSNGWNWFTYRPMNDEKNARSFILEFLQLEMGNFLITWMEVYKNPSINTLSNTISRMMMMMAPPVAHCPYSCPELGACINHELWCDGFIHCPSGYDEKDTNCMLNDHLIRIFSIDTLTISGLTIIFITIILIFTIIYYFYRYCQAVQQRKNVIVSVTEHTFLEFKSGLC